MKRFILPCVAVLALALSLPASATIISVDHSSLANDGYVPDYDASGWASTINLSGEQYAGLTVQSVSVNFTIAGGFNGDLYGYLVHDTGGFVVLLDRVGSNGNPYGFSNSGFDDVTLASAGSSISSPGAGGASYSSTAAVSSGTYQAQGNTFNSFTGSDVSGAWTLFFADRSSGDISQVTGWTLEINAVPEPTTWAMIFFGAVFAGQRVWVWRKRTA